MSIISKFLDSTKVTPGSTLYLGNKYDVIETKYVSLDRKSKRPNTIYEVPKEATEEQLEYLSNLVKERVLSLTEIKFRPMFEESYPQEIKTFTSKPVERMSMTELKYTAEKLNIDTSNIKEREAIRTAILSSLQKKPIRGKAK